ncbi:hypothetical protein QBC39DRAFT_338591 [Podospora conica]|nr:hypothetical protein QBC39DRAFT_338591 [Schizothecium conicum]
MGIIHSFWGVFVLLSSGSAAFPYNLFSPIYAPFQWLSWSGSLFFWVLYILHTLSTRQSIA